MRFLVGNIPLCAWCLLLSKRRTLLFALLMMWHPSAFARSYSLSDCIDYALKNRYDLKAYDIEDGNKQLDVKSQKYKFSPNLSANINNGLSQGYQQVFTEDAAGIYQSVQSYSNNASISLSMPLWSADAQRALIKVGELGRRQNLADKANQEFSVKLEIISCYYTLLVARENYNVAKSNYVSQDSVVSNTAKLHEIGKSSKRDLLDARTNLMQYKQDMAAQAYEVEKAEAALIEIMQFDSDSIEISSIDSLPMLPGFEEIYSVTIDNHPALKAKRIEISALETENKACRRQLYPSIYFNYELGTSSQFLQGQINRPASDQWGGNFHQNANISISIPIFSQLAIRNNIKKNEFSRAASENEANRLKRQIYDDLKVIHLDLSHTYELYDLAAQTEAMSGEQVRYASHSYSLGLLPSYELEIYRQKHTSAQRQAIKAKYEWLYKVEVLHAYLKLSENGSRL